MGAPTLKEARDMLRVVIDLAATGRVVEAASFADDYLARLFPPVGAPVNDVGFVPLDDEPVIRAIVARLDSLGDKLDSIMRKACRRFTAGQVLAGLVAGGQSSTLHLRARGAEPEIMNEVDLAQVLADELLDKLEHAQRTPADRFGFNCSHGVDNAVEGCGGCVRKALERLEKPAGAP